MKGSFMQKNQFYNHLTRSPYEIDFTKWIEPFNDGSKFFQNWFHHLLLASEQMYERNTTDDCFQFPYTSNDVTFLIHFNIGHIYSMCEKHLLLNLHKEKVSLDKFSRYGSPCDFAYRSVINWKFPKHAVSDFPVLCCYAPVQENNQMLVIDGNHRITIKKILHMKSVNVFEYQLNSSFDFANDFEYIAFHFLIECNKPAQARQINPEHVLSMPWLT